MGSYYDILKETIAYLNFQRDIGIRAYPITPGLRSLLEREETRKAPKPPIKKTPTNRSTPQGQTGTLTDIRKEIGDCTRCSLHQHRRSILFGHGHAQAKLCIISEWPTSQDDQTGTLFSGAEGEMLDNMLTHVLHLSREEIYITSLLKCRVPDNLHPEQQHIQTCKPFLLSQLSVIQPRIICTMGPLSAQTLLKTNKPLVRLRGRFHQVNNIPLLPTFHPSYLLKNPEMKKAALVDLQMVAKRLQTL